MSDALIQSQNTRISELQQELATTRAEAKKYRQGRREAIQERDALRTQVEQLTGERDTLRTQVQAAPGEQAQTIARLQGELRTRDHRDAFNQAAVAAGVDPRALGDLYRLSGLTPPESGEPKAEDFAAFLTAAKTERSWAFAAPAGSQPAEQPPGGATQGQALGANPPPPGSGRNASGTQASQVRYTRADVQAPGWQQARPDLVAAFSEGRAVMVDG